MPEEKRQGRQQEDHVILYAAEPDAELQLEGCWLNDGRTHNIPYLEDGYVYVLIRNNSGSEITLEKFAISLRTEEGLKPYESVSERTVTIKPGHACIPIPISFKADLSLTYGSNCYSIKLFYKRYGSQVLHTCSFPDAGYIVIDRWGQGTAVFVSHKDPENTAMAKMLCERYMPKVGFKGYIAEGEALLGLDFLKRKIFPKIDESKVVVVLWTEEAVNSETIAKEIVYAKEKGKQIIVLKEDIDLPSALFNQNEEYLPANGKITDEDLVELVKWMEYTLRTDGYRDTK
jgi:hypothetical protein